MSAGRSERPRRSARIAICRVPRPTLDRRFHRVRERDHLQLAVPTPTGGRGSFHGELERLDTLLPDGAEPDQRARHRPQVVLVGRNSEDPPPEQPGLTASTDERKDSGAKPDGMAEPIPRTRALESPERMLDRREAALEVLVEILHVRGRQIEFRPG